MAILNPKFEDAGAQPGEAEHWTLVTATSLERIAGFGPVPHRAWEDFERWFELALGFLTGALALAFFDPLAEGVEDFNEAWANDLYLTGLPTGQVIIAPFGSGGVENLEDGWDNVPFAKAWEDVAAVIGLFDAEPREDFNERWQGNEDFAWTLKGVTIAAAQFGPAALELEAFETAWPEATRL